MSHIFISHTSKDDAFVKELRDKLSAHKLTVWDDARKLRGGARLVPEIGEAIETARQFIVVSSQNAIESDWVFDEIAKALIVEQARKAEGYSVIPLLLPDFKADEAASLGQLGTLYNGMGRLEESATFYRQAAEIRVQLQGLAGEGRARNNLAVTLIKLQRYDEAGRELRRAIECLKTFGHAAELWKTWNILHNLEQATGNAQAAAEARGQAVAAYLAYRRAGGESRTNTAPLFALVAEALRQGTTAEAAAQLTELSQRDIPAWLTALLDKLHAVLRGDRGALLAADPALAFWDAVELQLLLESL